MAATTTIILGILAGGAAVGGALVVIDPLKARHPGERADADVASWSDGALDSVAAARAALQMLGYGPGQIDQFQGDVNEMLAWHRALEGGDERVPPDSAGFTQVPPALTEMGAAADLQISSQLDKRTVEFLSDAVRAVVVATGKSCMTDQGEVVEADASQCLAAWQDAFRYAYEANLQGAPRTASFTPRETGPDDWGRPSADEVTASGSYGPYLWRTYKDNSQNFGGQHYFTTWRTETGYEQPQGPFASAAAAKTAVTTYIAQQLGEPPPGPGLHNIPATPATPKSGITTHPATTGMGLHG